MIQRRLVARSLALVGVAALALGACGDDDGGSSSAPNLDGTWAISDTAFDKPVADALNDTNRPTLTIAGQAANGFNGCNQYNGSISYDAKKLSFGPLASTQMACESPASDIEAAYMAALDGVEGYELNGTTLRMKDGDGKVVLTFGKT